MAPPIDFAKIKWGAFTRNFKDYCRRRHHHHHPPLSAPKSLGQFADLVLARPDSFSPILRRRALFYRNIINPKRVPAKAGKVKRVSKARKLRSSRMHTPRALKRKMA